MTPKQAAHDIFVQMEQLFIDANADSWTSFGRKASVITVDALIKESSSKTFHAGRKNLSDKEFWKAVKKEIENI